jgi:hypothetical protein
MILQGVAFEEQIVEAVPTSKHDKYVDFDDEIIDVLKLLFLILTAFHFYIYTSRLLDYVVTPSDVYCSIVDDGISTFVEIETPSSVATTYVEVEVPQEQEQEQEQVQILNNSLSMTSDVNFDGEPTNGNGWSAAFAKAKKVIK